FGDFDDVVRGGFLHAGGADADVAGLLAELGEILGAEITHAALDAADEGVEHVVHRAGNFLEGLDALGGDLANGVVFVVAVTGGGAGLHGGVGAHAAVLFVDLAGDFHDLARRFAATGQQAA